MRAAVLAVCLALAASSASADEGFDWDVREQPAGPEIRWLRGARDGVVGLFDALADLQIGVFSEVALDLGGLAMATSDGLGLLDDNAVSQHVFKSVGSKSLARTAYLLHIAGAEAILGSHGLEAEWYLAEALEELNPLLAEQQPEPRLPLEPLAFVGEGMLHGDVYRVQRPGVILAATVVSDALLRPAGSLLRIAGLRAAADTLDERAQAIVRGALP